MEVLSGLGIAERVERVSYRLSNATIMRGDRPLVTMAWIPPDSRYPYTYVVPQSGLEEILAARLLEWGVPVERDIELTSVSADDAQVVATMADGSTIAADWLIGADGARSRVRESVGIGFPHQVTGETYYLADATIDLDVDIGDSAMWLGRNGPLMFMRLPGDDHSWRVFVDMTDRASRRRLPELTREKLVSLLSSRGPGTAEVESLSWTSVFQTRLGLADSYRSDRVVIAGDAGHVFPPFGGQGMNLGIQDAVNLSWRLAAVVRGEPESLLDEYERERRAVAQATIRDVEARRRMYALRNPIARSARDLLLRLAGGNPRAARRASLQNSQLLTTYRAVTPGGDRGQAPRPGDRAPDGPFKGGTLHEHFAPDHWTLLEFETLVTRETVERESGLHTVRIPLSADTSLNLRQRYGVGDAPEYVLVRPDGHIATRSSKLAEVRSQLPTI
ncbi:4,5-epoxidase [Brevibacterium sanguinis]|uniref:4,5-epoxidase n=3 Tax=Brevibacteriaceae TaxID=85019 RepID=A0A366IM30_9MICO|nr:4,5-epoxidase [Brevibacterium sanguinis]RBP73796.1 4,5-epoxidase [Brevibacterium celere]